MVRGLDSRPSSWRRFRFAGVVALASLNGVGAAASDRAQVLEIAGGTARPADEDQREIFGNGAALALAYSARPGQGDTWVFAEAGLVHASGFTYDRDPTFFLDDTHQWLLPLTLGVRTALSNAKRVRARTYAGIGFQVAAAWRDDPLRGTANGMALGVVFHLRQDFAFAERAGIWLQPRYVLLSPVDYGSIKDVNHSGLSLELGMSFGKSAGTLRQAGTNGR